MNTVTINNKQLPAVESQVQRELANRGIVLTDNATINLPDVNSSEYWFDGVFQHQRYERDVYKIIEAVGLKGSKKSWGYHCREVVGCFCKEGAA